MTSELRPALVLFVLLSALTGIVYPLAVTGVAQALWAKQANGSLLVQDGRAVGSRLIGQSFTEPKYFWSRPSATAPTGYNAGASSGSNLGPLNPALADAVKARVAALRVAEPGQAAVMGGAGAGQTAALPVVPVVPVDLVTASASGLDPHVSRAAADVQVARVARVRGLAEADVRALVERQAEGVWLGVLGTPRVNVLELNLALDALARR